MGTLGASPPPPAGVRNRSGPSGGEGGALLPGGARDGPAAGSMSIGESSSTATRAGLRETSETLLQMVGTITQASSAQYTSARSRRFTLQAERSTSPWHTRPWPLCISRRPA